MSQLEVDKVIPQSGTTLTLGESGDTITIASGATFTPTLIAPIIDEINDNNGNEEIIFTTTTSAVNELTIANAATGNAPEIAATGDDTDIDLKLTPKGAGNLVLDGIEFPNADGSAGEFLQTDGSGVLSFASAGAAAGQVIQVVSTVVSGTVTISVNNASADITGLSATITPSSASNKILILYKINYSNASSDTFVGNLLRGATNIFQGTAGTGQQGTVSFQTANMNNYWSLEAGGSFLDSPNTTSATTYKFQAFAAGNQTMRINRTERGGSGDPLVPSSITLMEIKG
jgi:hypothetical protein